jgi:hypothetical protein
LGVTDGQASIELVALLPLFLAIALASAQLLAAGAAGELAANGAEAGALALIKGADRSEAEQAVRRAMPDIPRKRVEVNFRDQNRLVQVKVLPRSPIGGLRKLLVRTAERHAGPRRVA